MKYLVKAVDARVLGSLPAWGVRVEIHIHRCSLAVQGGHSPHGECGLKSHSHAIIIARERHSPHGECGLKLLSVLYAPQILCHSPHGECGLKWIRSHACIPCGRSLPAWGVRVEICCRRSSRQPPRRHSPLGECGLKSMPTTTIAPMMGHSPHGECGLKLLCLQYRGAEAVSLPAWGVRVEICRRAGRLQPHPRVTPRMGSAG